MKCILFIKSVKIKQIFIKNYKICYIFHNNFQYYRFCSIISYKKWLIYKFSNVTSWVFRNAIECIPVKDFSNDSIKQYRFAPSLY